MKLSDVRAVYETVHECRELWADPEAWQAHAMRRVTAATRCRVGLIYEMEDADGYSGNRVLSAADVGWESAGERTRLAAGVAHLPVRASPLYASFADRLPVRGGGGDGDGSRPGLTYVQDRCMAWRDWLASDWYDHHVRPTRLGPGIMSAVWMPQTQTWSHWCLAMDRSDGRLAPRQERIAELFHRALAPLIGTSLCTWRDRSLGGLSPVRRRVLAALLEGRSEREIAERTYRSHAAVHDHVKAIYRHFGVGSRAGLSAYFIRCTPRHMSEPPRPESLEAWLHRR